MPMPNTSSNWLCSPGWAARCEARLERGQGLFKSRAMTILVVIIGLVSCALLDILLMSILLGGAQP